MPATSAITARSSKSITETASLPFTAIFTAISCRSESGSPNMNRSGFSEAPAAVRALTCIMRCGSTTSHRIPKNSSGWPAFYPSPRGNAARSVARCEPRIGIYRWPLPGRGGVPHQSGIESLGREHGQDYDGTKGERAGAGLDCDYRAERDQRAQKRLHENVDH